MYPMKGRMYLTRHVIVICVLFNSSTGIPLDELIQSDEEGLVLTESYAKEVAALKEELATLQERLTKLKSRSANTKDGVIITKGRIEDIINNNHILRKRAIRRRIRRPEVAFQASLTEKSATFKLYDTIIFNNVLTNIGHAYNKHTGVFTAPVAGTYVFNTNIVSGKGHYVEASIQVNDVVTVSAISDHRVLQNDDHFTTWDQGNAVAILRLNRGNKVAVSVQWPQGSHVIHGVGKSSFSGYLLR